jgi:hypothetical protein
MKFIALFLTVLALAPVSPVSPYKLESIMLLQPDFVLQRRVPSVDALSSYVKAVEAATGDALSSKTPSPASGYIVLAVRPRQKSNVWFDFNPTLPEATERHLRAAILAVPPFPAKEGTVVFALNVTLWNASPSSGFPNPSEWRKAMEGSEASMEITDLVDRLVWPDETGP